MSDSSKISAEQMQAFLDAKGLERPCELCGQTVWAIPVSHSGADLTLLALGDEVRKLYFPAYAIYCQNCGNTKALEAGVIERWVADNG